MQVQLINTRNRSSSEDYEEKLNSDNISEYQEEEEEEVAEQIYQENLDHIHNIALKQSILQQDDLISSLKVDIQEWKQIELTLPEQSEARSKLEYYNCYQSKDPLTLMWINYGNKYEHIFDLHNHDISKMSIQSMIYMGKFLNTLASKLNKKSENSSHSYPNFRFRHKKKIYENSLLYKHRVHIIYLLQKILLILSNFQCTSDYHNYLKDRNRIGCISVRQHISTILQVLSVTNKAIEVIENTTIDQYIENIENDYMLRFPIYFYTKTIRCMKAVLEARFFELTFLTHIYNETNLIPRDLDCPKEYYWLPMLKCIILYEIFANEFVLLTEIHQNTEKNYKLSNQLYVLMKRYLFHFYTVRTKLLFDMAIYYHKTDITELSLTVTLYSTLIKYLQKWYTKYLLLANNDILSIENYDHYDKIDKIDNNNNNNNNSIIDNDDDNIYSNNDINILIDKTKIINDFNKQLSINNNNKKNNKSKKKENYSNNNDNNKKIEMIDVPVKKKKIRKGEFKLTQPLTEIYIPPKIDIINQNEIETNNNNNNNNNNDDIYTLEEMWPMPKPTSVEYILKICNIKNNSIYNINQYKPGTINIPDNDISSHMFFTNLEKSKRIHILNNNNNNNDGDNNNFLYNEWKLLLSKQTIYTDCIELNFSNLL